VPSHAGYRGDEDDRLLRNAGSELYRALPEKTRNLKNFLFLEEREIQHHVRKNQSMELPCTFMHIVT
jgi:hypothetical protein